MPATMDQHTTWPALLKAKRDEKRISQTHLGRLIGVSRQAVFLWEQGTTWPRPEYVQKLVAELGITDAELAAVYRRGPDPEAAA